MMTGCRSRELLPTSHPEEATRSRIAADSQELDFIRAGFLKDREPTISKPTFDVSL
jgi:hypothetical protein